jgi:DMSO/TMAO reductase YedYZ molybdopterin-dependent catalytic subunit
MASVAEPGQAITLEELQLATRNRGMPLEGLRYDITPSGLHYLLIHFDIPDVDAATWRLQVGGALERPAQLTLDQIRSRPSVTIPVTMECAGNGRARFEPRPLSQPWLVEAIGTATWTGTPLGPLLDECAIAPEAVELVFTGADRGVQGDIEQDYQRSLTIAEARERDVLLAYEMNGRPLEPQHGFPLRLLVPGWYGMTSVKWLTAIDAVTEPFTGYQQAEAYQYRASDDDPGEPATRMRIKALMIPPGIPDFFTRNRVLDNGPVTLRGRAWSGMGAVARVEVGVDGHWRDAELGPPLGDHAWRSWSFHWTASAGEHVLSCRATDTDGHTQPTDQPWNVKGLGNNQVQEVPVLVR